MAGSPDGRLPCLMLDADEYLALQRVFAVHFARGEQYLERLTDQLLLRTEPLPAPDMPQRAQVQMTAPEETRLVTRHDITPIDPPGV